MPITDNLCKSAAPRGKPYKIFDSRGLFMIVMPNGSKYWRLKYRYAGSENQISLGV